MGRRHRGRPAPPWIEGEARARRLQVEGKGGKSWVCQAGLAPLCSPELAPPNMLWRHSPRFGANLDVITRDQVVPLLTEACPSVSARLAKDGTFDEGLLYLIAGAVARALIPRLDELDPEVDAVFDLIERLHVEGDEYVSELATIGFLESLQTPGDTAVMAACERRLGPESRRWWKGLLGFWGGGAPYVCAVDD